MFSPKVFFSYLRINITKEAGFSVTKKKQLRKTKKGIRTMKVTGNVINRKK